MANVPLVANPILPPVPDEPKVDDAEQQRILDALWKWMKDVSLQLKILFGSPQASNSAISTTLVQSGTILPFGGSNVPSGYLLCDGSQVSQVQYAGLFSAIGTLWNSGGESPGNFRLPDFRGRSLVGSGAGTGLTNRVLGTLGGEETHTLVTGELPAHGHGVGDTGHIHADGGHSHALPAGLGISNISFGGGDGGNNWFAHAGGVSSAGGANILNSVTGISILNTGGGAAHNNMQPYAVATWMIKF